MSVPARFPTVPAVQLFNALTTQEASPVALALKGSAAVVLCVMTLMSVSLTMEAVLPSASATTLMAVDVVGHVLLVTLGMVQLAPQA